MKKNRTIPDEVLNELPHARYDKNAIDLVLDIYHESVTSIFKELYAMKRSIKEIDEYITKDLINEERIFDADTEIDPKRKKTFLSEVHDEMYTVIESRGNAINLWPLAESSDADMRQNAAHNWAISTMQSIENRVAGNRTSPGKAISRNKIHDLLIPALQAKGYFAEFLSGALSSNSSSAIVSSSFTTIKARDKSTYCNIFDILSTARDAGIRGSAKSALSKDCSL